MTARISKSRWVKSALAAAASLAVGAAGATVIDFEPGHTDTSNAPFAPLLSHFDELQQAPYSMVPYSSKAGAQAGDLVGALVDGSDLDNTCLGLICPSNNPTTFYAALNDGVLALVRTDGAANVLVQKFDASFVAVAGDTVQPTALILRVDAYNATSPSPVARNDFYLPGPSNGTYSFATYSLDNTFANPAIVEVDFYGYFCTPTNCNRSSDKAQFALDNIAVVPEPAEWLLMAGGLVALGAWRRRRAG